MYELKNNISQHKAISLLEKCNTEFSTELLRAAALSRSYTLQFEEPLSEKTESSVTNVNIHIGVFGQLAFNISKIKDSCCVISHTMDDPVSSDFLGGGHNDFSSLCHVSTLYPMLNICERDSRLSRNERTSVIKCKRVQMFPVINRYDEESETIDDKDTISVVASSIKDPSDLESVELYYRAVLKAAHLSGYKNIIVPMVRSTRKTGCEDYARVLYNVLFSSDLTGWFDSVDIICRNQNSYRVFMEVFS